MSHHADSPESIAAQAKLIEDFGGPKAVADAINARLGSDFTGQAVSNWKHRGIPYRYRGPLVVLAQDRNIATPPDFFGVGTPATEA